MTEVETTEDKKPKAPKKEKADASAGAPAKSKLRKFWKFKNIK